MTTTARPPVDLEHKAAAGLLAPRPAPGGRPARPAPSTGATEVDDDTGTVTAIVAVTGVVDDVNDLLQPGCFARTLRERPEIKMVLGHDWLRPVGRTISAVELLPGDPGCPAPRPTGRRGRGRAPC